MMEGRKPEYRYETCSRMVRITKGMFDAINDIDSGWYPIFNQKKNDFRRSQVRLDSSNNSELNKLGITVQHRIRRTNWLDGRKFGVMNVLKSEPGCERQHYHNDYKVCSRAEVVPASALVALEKTSILVEGKFF